MYLQDIVSSSVLTLTLFSFLTVFFFFFFSTSDDIGIGRELFLPESTFTYTAVKVWTFWSFYSKQMQREKRDEVMRCCGFKMCHQANYVFMKEVEQISG